MFIIFMLLISDENSNCYLNDLIRNFMPLAGHYVIQMSVMFEIEIKVNFLLSIYFTLCCWLLVQTAFLQSILLKDCCNGKFILQIVLYYWSIIISNCFFRSMVLITKKKKMLLFIISKAIYFEISVYLFTLNVYIVS